MRKGLLASLFLGLPLIIALFGWIMSRELSHDEQLFVSAGVLVRDMAIYKDFLYGHLPNYPLLLGAIYSLADTTHYLLVARLSIFLAWLLSLACLYSIAMRWTQSRLMAVSAMLLLLTNELLLAGPAVYATNSFIPVPFALFGIFLFFEALESARRASLLLFLSGVSLSLAVGMKANYVFVLLPTALALIFANSTLPIKQRLLTRLLPFVTGGLLAAIPTVSASLFHFDAFFYSVFAGATGTHIQYWQQHQPDNPTLELFGRLRYGFWLWTSGTSLLMLFCVIAGFVAVYLQHGMQVLKAALTDIKVGTTALLGALAVVVSFIPTPSFTQYFTPPIPFAILFLLAFAGASSEITRGTLKALLVSAAIVGLALNSSIYLAGLAAAWNPAAWTGMKTYSAAQAIRELVCAEHGEKGPCQAVVATLAPIFILEAGLRVYPELAAGPFVYRQADFLPPSQLARLRAASVKTLPDLLERSPPAAVFIGFEGGLDEPLAAFALRHKAIEQEIFFAGGVRYLYVMPR